MAAFVLRAGCAPALGQHAVGGRLRACDAKVVSELAAIPELAGRYGSFADFNGDRANEQV